MTNALTVDVEDYFHVSAFESVCDPCTWSGRECRVESNTEKVLGILDAHSVKATFFVLGWVAERFPGLVRSIAEAGHEVASHGYGHRRVSTLGREEFREDVRRSKAMLEDQAGIAVEGYRAPSYSISPSCLWAFDELVAAGYRYDSSVFPVRHDLYGIAEWPRFPFWLERMSGEEQGNWVPAEEGGRRSTDGDRRGSDDEREWGGESGSAGTRQRTTEDSARLLEVPITTLRLLGRNVPIAGGGYFRLFPYAFTRWGLSRINRLEGRPFVFYLHPWELDPAQPRVEGAGLKSRFRHYLNLERTEARLRRLLLEFRFGPVKDALASGGLAFAEVDGGERPNANRWASSAAAAVGAPPEGGAEGQRRVEVR